MICLETATAGRTRPAPTARPYVPTPTCRPMRAPNKPPAVLPSSHVHSARQAASQTDRGTAALVAVSQTRTEPTIISLLHLLALDSDVCPTPVTCPVAPLNTNTFLKSNLPPSAMNHTERACWGALTSLPLHPCASPRACSIAPLRPVPPRQPFRRSRDIRNCACTCLNPMTLPYYVLRRWLVARA